MTTSSSGVSQQTDVIASLIDSLRMVSTRRPPRIIAVTNDFVAAPSSRLSIDNDNDDDDGDGDGEEEDGKAASSTPTQRDDHGVELFSRVSDTSEANEYNDHHGMVIRG
jgi:hypothetical protein